MASSVFGPLGGVVGKILPIVGVITTIITVIQLVKNHLQEIRAFIEKTFGSEALAIFDKIVALKIFSLIVISEKQETRYKRFSGIKAYRYLIRLLISLEK